MDDCCQFRIFTTPLSELDNFLRKNLTFFSRAEIALLCNLKICIGRYFLGLKLLKYTIIILKDSYLVCIELCRLIRNSLKHSSMKFHPYLAAWTFKSSFFSLSLLSFSLIFSIFQLSEIQTSAQGNLQLIISDLFNCFFTFFEAK